MLTCAHHKKNIQTCLQLMIVCPPSAPVSSVYSLNSALHLLKLTFSTLSYSMVIKCNEPLSIKRVLNQCFSHLKREFECSRIFIAVGKPPYRGELMLINADVAPLGANVCVKSAIACGTILFIN